MKKRTAQKSKGSYEDTWNDALAIIEKDMVDEDKDVVEILDNLLRKKVHQRFEKKFFRDFHRKLGITLKRNQALDKRLVVQNNKYAIVPLETILDYTFIDILAQFINKKKDQIDYVVELGSGIGINLFFLADRIEPDLRRRLIFFSCEFTDSGKTACEKLLSFSDQLKMFVEHFDYYQPNFSYLGPQKNVLFFTAHSIEQIPKMERAVFEVMLEASNQCYCYHAEPVGWQYDEQLKIQRRHLKPNHWKRKRSNLKKRLLKLDRSIFSKLGIGIMDTSHKYGINIEETDIGKPDKVSSNAAYYSFAHDYNTNLVSLLKKMESEGLISIDTELVNLYGKNPFNPSTIISWHKRL